MPTTRSYERPLAEPMAALIVSLAGPYEHIVAPATTNGKNYMPRAAALLDVMQISDISEVKSPDTFVRLDLCRQRRADGAVERHQEGHHGAHRGLRGDGRGRLGADRDDRRAGRSRPFVLSGREPVEDRPAGTDLGQHHHLGRARHAERRELQLLDKVADKLGAAVGASRAAVDAGYVPNDYQVGQTGKVVAPDLYIAVGISGAIQHLAGMKDSKVIVAINKDEEAPIFQVADYGLVADLFTAVPELEAELAKLGK